MVQSALGKRRPSSDLEAAWPLSRPKTDTSDLSLPKASGRVCRGETLHTMAHIFLAIYLILVGLNILIGINLPAWVLGIFALIAGILLLAERFGITTRRK